MFFKVRHVFSPTRVTVMKYGDGQAALCILGRLRMRGNPQDHRVHRAPGELWDSTGFPSWSVSQSNGGAPQGLFRMSAQRNASSATSSDWRLLFDRAQRGIPKAHPHVVIPSSGWGLRCAITAPASVCLRGEEIAGNPAWIVS